MYRVLTEHDLLAPTDQKPNYSFFATGDASSFESLAKRFLGPEVTGVKRIERKK